MVVSSRLKTPVLGDVKIKWKILKLEKQIVLKTDDVDVEIQEERFATLLSEGLSRF